MKPIDGSGAFAPVLDKLLEGVRLTLSEQEILEQQKRLHETLAAEHKGIPIPFVFSREDLNNLKELCSLLTPDTKALLFWLFDLYLFGSSAALKEELDRTGRELEDHIGYCIRHGDFSDEDRRQIDEAHWKLRDVSHYQPIIDRIACTEQRLITAGYKEFVPESGELKSAKRGRPTKIISKLVKEIFDGKFKPAAGNTASVRTELHRLISSVIRYPNLDADISRSLESHLNEYRQARKEARRQARGRN